MEIWRFSGDDLDSGGLVKHPSDIEWTVRYGVRSGDPYARGVEAADWQAVTIMDSK